MILLDISFYETSHGMVLRVSLDALTVSKKMVVSVKFAMKMKNITHLILSTCVL